MPEPATQMSGTDVPSSGYYQVRYTYPGSSCEATTMFLGAYSPDEAGQRVKHSVVGKAVTILSVTQLGASEQVTCTYEGGEGAVYPEGPWVFMEWEDKWAPLITCDVHGHPAHPCVYDSDPEDRHYSGPCRYHPDPYVPPSPTRASHG